MTEEYWQKYKKDYDQDVFQRNLIFKDVQDSLKRDQKPKHIFELNNMCKSDNAYIRQIKNSPNITTDTVAEMICRDVGCDLQYCLSLQKVANNNSKKIVKYSNKSLRLR